MSLGPKRARSDPDGTEEQSLTRSKILQAAIPLFESQGAHGTTTRQIAATANVNSQLIYYYFGDKNGLFAAALAEVGGRVGRLLATAANEGGSVREQLARFIIGWVKITLAEAGAVRMLHRAMLEGNRSMDASIQHFADSHTAQIVSLIARGITDGVFRADLDPERAVASLVGMVQYLAIAEHYLPLRSMTAKSGRAAIARDTAELFLRGLDSR